MPNFVSRRNAIFKQMQENSVLLCFSGKEKVVSADELYPFSVNKNFFYLTGITQENCVLMLIKGIGENKTYLFVDECNPVKEKWIGKKITFEEAREISGITNISSSESFDTMLSLALTNENNEYGAISICYLDLTPELKIGDALSTQEFANITTAKFPHISIFNCFDMFSLLRKVKDEDEINNLKEAINLTSLGITDLIINLRSGLKEYELSDRFEAYGRNHDRHKLAFSTICATGEDAIVLHCPYEMQNATLKDGDLVLFDLGFSHNGYSADVSRTYPINGRFTEMQRKIYEAVLNCNKACIERIRKGMTMLEMNDFAKEFLRSECIRLGLMDEKDDLFKYYYHSVGHHLGLDTHDIISRDVPLEVGSVVTIEPGLYFKELGIGVRIEDDVLITDGRPIVLTANIKKEIDDIEKMFVLRSNL